MLFHGTGTGSGDKDGSNDLYLTAEYMEATEASSIVNMQIFIVDTLANFESMFFSLYRHRQWGKRWQC
jgi:hypothetical protein